MPTFYNLSAEENYDSTRITYINALGTYVGTSINTNQGYQGMQWDPVRRNLMYLYTEYTPTTPVTNTTGHNLWDGAFLNVTGSAMDAGGQFNSSVGVKNIDTGIVNFYLNYNVANTVPAGIGGGGSDGTYRRNTRDFQAGGSPHSDGNGPGMTDPYTGNYWINSQSCQLYCFRLSDNYSQVISPLYPLQNSLNNVTPVGFTNTGATNPWTFAKEIDYDGGSEHTYLYLLPRLLTSAEITADYLLAYATYTYPVPIATVPMQFYYQAYNREVFDHAGNMFLFTCAAEGTKDFKLYKFSPPTAANYPTPAVGGGFTDITPWGLSTGPNGDGTSYTLQRNVDTENIESYALIPMYLPATDDLVLVEKFFPSEKTALSVDPADMFWSATYVHTPAGTPTWEHHSKFVTGYMTADWAPTTIGSAAYSVLDAFEVNTYLGQSDYVYDIDYSNRWFFFLCTKMTGGVSDGKPRIVLVNYSFVYGSAPSVVKVIDEQGWDDNYPTYAPKANDAYVPFTSASTNAIALSMQTTYNRSFGYPMWDIGIHDPVTDTFWWGGGSSDKDAVVAQFCQFNPSFVKRMQDGSHIPGAGTNLAATPPFLKMSVSTGPLPPAPVDKANLRAWRFPQDNHEFYVVQLGSLPINQLTLVYDKLSDTWSQWKSPDFPYFRGADGCEWKGLNVCCDTESGKIWQIDPEGRLDYETTPIVSQIFTGITERFRTLVPCYLAELAVSEGKPPEGIDATTVGIQLRSGDGLTWYDHGTVPGEAIGDNVTVRWYGLGLMQSPGKVFEITDTGYARCISGFTIETGTFDVATKSKYKSDETTF